MGSILRCQLQQEAADMFLDCRERDHQLPGDLLVGGPLCQQTQNLLFALGKRLKELLCSLRGRAWQSFGGRRDDLLLNVLALLVLKGGEHCMGIGSKCRWDRGGVLLHVRSLEQCLECLLHRSSSIEKDAKVPFRRGLGEQAKENAKRLLRGTRRLQSSYLQRQDSNYTPHSRNLLSAAQQCCEQLQGKCILELRYIESYQCQI